MKTFLHPEQTKQEKNSYMMLFCALLMAKKSKAPLEEAIGVVPLVGNAKYLADELLA